MKKVSEKLKGITKDSQYLIITDRSKPVDYKSIKESLVPDLSNRKPMVICDENGDYIGTTLDMQSFFYHLAKMKAVINVPKYEAMRETVLKEGEHLVSKENRHGKVTGLSSNATVHSMGIRITDTNVMTSQDVGEPRVFNVLDVEGNWHKGWRTIQFIPIPGQEEFITKLASGNEITFTKFVNEQRRFNIFSHQYFMIKTALVRVDDEAKYLKGVIKIMLDSGITYPETGEDAKKEWPKQSSLGNTKKIIVKSVTYEADIPPLTGSYPMIEMTQENLIKITKRVKELIYGIKTQLQFYIRGEEFAHFKYANPEKPFPHWMKNIDWADYKSPPKFTVNANFIKKFKGNEKAILTLMRDRVYKENELPQFSIEYSELNKAFFNNAEVPAEVREKIKVTKGKTAYKRLIIFQEDVGKYGVSLLKKEFEKTETVNENY